MAVNPASIGPKPQFMDSNGDPAVGYKMFFYAAGSSTKQNTYTDSTGNTANSNPLVLNSLGQPDTEIWFTAGLTYKIVFAPPTDTDPPASAIWTINDQKGQNDTTVTIDQWVASGAAPTYVSATQFTVPGDQTSIFQVRRRIKASVTAGTAYGDISVSTYNGVSLTTVTVVNDAGSALDSGLSAVQLGLTTPTNTSIPKTVPDGLSTGHPTWDTSGNLTVSGNFGLTANAARITADLSNATVSNQLIFQSSTTNGTSVVNAMPNGTGISSGFRAFNNSNPDAASAAVLNISTTAVFLQSTRTGAGAYLPFIYFTNGVQQATLDTTGNFLVINATGGLGYGTGSGGAVTQLTSKSTAVTLNKTNGQITMNNSSLGAGVVTGFVMSNSMIAATDTVIVNGAGALSANYRIETRGLAAGVISIFVTNLTGGALTDALVINFAVIKGVTS
jgi:hypothetical protein